MNLDRFSRIYSVDFEFQQLDGETPTVHCMVAEEIRSGKVGRWWVDELGDSPPIPDGDDVLFIAYNVVAEMSCYLELGWSIPQNIIDPFVEFKLAWNGGKSPTGSGQLGAMMAYGVPGITSDEKDEFRDLAIRGGPFTAGERRQLLDYCESDVRGLSELFRRMVPTIDLPRALIRGQYMATVATIQRNGIPIDVDTLNKLRHRWESMKLDIIRPIDKKYRCYQGTTFKTDAFVRYLFEQGIYWEYDAGGSPILRRDVFRDMAKVYPQLQDLHELRSAMGQFRLEKLAIGSDNRNRCNLWPFSSITGRNQPGGDYIFGYSTWIRNLIKPEPGHALAYLDYSMQEIGIAAKLSDDVAMQSAYQSDDFYITFAQMAGAVPDGATKKTHPDERSRFKQCALGVQFGMGAYSLSRRIKQQLPYAQGLLQLHRRTFPDFWEWRQSAIDHAYFYGRLWTTFGWERITSPDARPTSLGNHCVQGNGAEMLRLACILATRAGIKIVAPVHDAILIEAPENAIQDVVRVAREQMELASQIVLDGFTIRTDADVIHSHERYSDERGQNMWRTVTQALAENDQPTSSTDGGYNTARKVHATQRGT